jgi:hypothetical protein
MSVLGLLSPCIAAAVFSLQIRQQGVEIKGARMKPIVAYYRVSTQKQARSGKKGLGLGLEAQREALERFAQANGLQIVAEFTEIFDGAMLPETQVLFLCWLAMKRSRASRFSRSSCSRVVRA